MDLEAWKDLYASLGVVWSDPRDALAAATSELLTGPASTLPTAPARCVAQPRDLDALVGCQAQGVAPRVVADNRRAPSATARALALAALPPPPRDPVVAFDDSASAAAFDDLLDGSDDDDAPEARRVDVEAEALCKRRRTVPTVMWATAPARPPSPDPSPPGPSPSPSRRTRGDTGAVRLAKWERTLRGAVAEKKTKHVLRVLKILGDSDASIGELGQVRSLVDYVAVRASQSEASASSLRCRERRPTGCLGASSRTLDGAKAPSGSRRVARRGPPSA